VQGKSNESEGTDSESNSFDKNDEMSEDELIVLGGKGAAESDGGSGKGGKKRRRGVKKKVKVQGEGGSRNKSKVWDVFDKVTMPDPNEKGKVLSKAKCKYCKKMYAYIQGSTTSTLSRHMKNCDMYKKHIAEKLDQKLLSFAPSKAGESGSSLPTITSPKDYNHDQVKKLIAKMIIVHEYPFRMVEHTWFNIVMTYLNPLYQFIGRKTIKAECLKVYESEKEALAKIIKGVDFISLTTDLWTSNQTLSYMCLVAHYIDSDWKMQYRVLNFFELDPPHKGPVIGQAAYDCVAAWKIEDKIISLTLDNAANNDGAIRGLRARFAARQGYAFSAKYFHVRCCAHIINLVVNDGTTALASLIENLRCTVKYLKKSPSRMHKFVEICRSLALQIGEGMRLDVSTRWSSTYKMLRTAIAYKEAIQTYADADLNYKWEPTTEEWDLFVAIEPILASLAKVTTALSASSYPTTNLFYPHIVDVKIALRAAMFSNNLNLKKMGTAMMEKFNKYWEEKNNVMVVATILDPRYKMRYIEWCFGRIFDVDQSGFEIQEVRAELEKLYEECELQHREKKAAQSKTNASSSLTIDRSCGLSSASCEFQSYLSSTEANPSKSELLIYLDELNVSLEDKEFDLLNWWKVNSHRFPVVSKMAKKFLTVPATSVSSESTFSTGGRTLDDYRSSLSPSTVEALICASSWIRGAHDGTHRYVVCYSLTICSSWFLFFCLTLITLSIFRKKMRRMTSRIFHFQKAL